MGQESNHSNKVLLLSSEFPPGPGGIGNHAFSLSKELAGHAIKVFIVCDADYVGRDAVEAFDMKLGANIRVTRVYRDGFKTYLRRIIYAMRLVKREKIKTVIVSGKFSLWTGGVLKLLGFRVKVVAILHGSEINIGHVLPRTVTQWAMGKADLLLPVSRFSFGLMPEKLKKRRSCIIPNGIDLGEFGDLDKQEALPVVGSPSLLTVGNVTPRKGQHRVIKALPKLIEKYPNIHYHVVGLPSHGDALVALAKELNVIDHVTIHGRLAHREQLAGMYKGADCFVILSENQKDGDVEGFGIVVLEANYFGLPAIGAKGCGIEDAIENGFNGQLVDGDDPEQICTALETILMSKDDYHSNSKQWAKQHDWKEIGERFLHVLDLHG